MKKSTVIAANFNIFLSVIKQLTEKVQEEYR
jgi:hypothetical protein